jgi:hypothetical protein
VHVLLHVLLQAVAEEFFVLATREAHTRRLQQLEQQMQHSLHVMRMSEAELATMYGLDGTTGRTGRVQVGWFLHSVELFVGLLMMTN